MLKLTVLLIVSVSDLDMPAHRPPCSRCVGSGLLLLRQIQTLIRQFQCAHQATSAAVVGLGGSSGGTRVDGNTVEGVSATPARHDPTFMPPHEDKSSASLQARGLL